ncbi:MAG TPA: hypothetical protein VFP59_06545 [Candidatus Angelobacter sp.]|nr:hypothetical protein [Candidatus Angelobacter sp.]
MDTSLQMWVRRIGIPVLLAAILLLIFPVSARIVGPVLGVAAWTGAAVGYIFIFLGIPFLLVIVGRPVYRMFLKPYLRARRIRLIRERRLLQEAAARGDSAQR